MAIELTDFEKLIDGMTTMAGLVIAYYNALVEGGMPKKEALTLTIEFQKAVINK
jgi:hypothetical protein